jgi:hypothetical protein
VLGHLFFQYLLDDGLDPWMRRLISSLVNLLSSSRSIPPSMLNPQNTRHYPFKRLERAVRAGQVSAKVKGGKHLPLSLLKGLVGEGYLRVERLELKPHQKRQELKAVPDPRLVGTAYRLTRKGRALLSGAPTPQMNLSGAPAPQMNGSPR